MKNAQVYLIGAGNLELLTLGAICSIRLANAILIDDLVNPGILELACNNTQIAHVGKRGGCNSTPQAFIHRKMISLAHAGKIVARIKGGDPFMFGRSDKELQALRQTGIPVSIISGIISGMAVTTTLDIPLTHRHYTHGVTFITGHTQETVEPNWQALATGGTTLAIYMGMSNLGNIVQKLTANGLSRNTPATGKITSPAIVIIGKVVRFSRISEQISQKLAA